MNQLQLHSKIDYLTSDTPSDITQEEVRSIIYKNLDARRYFFTQADDRWIDWLFQNDFLNITKLTQEYQGNLYTMPELQYLDKVASEKSSSVTQVIKAIPCTELSFDANLIEKLTYLISKLSPKDIALLIDKMEAEEWVSHMKAIRWGYSFKDILTKLDQAREFSSLLKLSRLLLQTRKREESETILSGHHNDDSFYFQQITGTDVLERIRNIGQDHLQESYQMILDTVREVVLLRDKPQDSKVFTVYDGILWYDISFFDLSIHEFNGIYDKNHKFLIELAVTLKYLTERISDLSSHSEVFNMGELYQTYIKPLPDSQALWRYKMYFLTLHSEIEILNDELQQELDRLIEAGESYHDIWFCIEYQQSLSQVFDTLSESYQRNYIEKSLELFIHLSKVPDLEQFVPSHAGKFFSLIQKSLDTFSDLKNKVNQAGFDLNQDYTPKKSRNNSMGGWVNSQSPITLEEWKKHSIPELITLLTTEYLPEKLREKNDFASLNPFDAEGVSDVLRADIPHRYEEYLSFVTDFFENDKMDKHYQYSLLRGIYEYLKEQKESIDDSSWEILLTCFQTWGENQTENIADIRDGIEWLAGWRSIYSIACDILEVLLNNADEAVLQQYRSKVLDQIAFFLSIPDPTQEAEEKYMNGDPFSVAINSIRGKAFEALVYLIFLDGKDLQTDVKELYLEVLAKEDTRAIYFLYGRYFANFYFRDKVWMNMHIDDVFPEGTDKNRLFEAALQGYLSNNLYQDIFEHPKFHKIYARGIDISAQSTETPPTRQSLSEALPNHLALAFFHYKSFDLEAPLMQAFLKQGSAEQKAHFVGHIHGQIVTEKQRENSEVDLVQRLKALWEYFISSYNPDTDREIMNQFGAWLQKGSTVFPVDTLLDLLIKTLKKVPYQQYWYTEHTKELTNLINTYPQKIFNITELYLLKGLTKGDTSNYYLFDEQWELLFQKLSQNLETTEATKRLINDLLEHGSQPFWKLKQIVPEEKVGEDQI